MREELDVGEPIARKAKVKTLAQVVRGLDEHRARVLTKAYTRASKKNPKATVLAVEGPDGTIYHIRK